MGPRSLTWRYFGDTRFVFVIGQAFVLQVAHPVINAAVDTQSTYKSDPWGRVERSFRYLWPVVYSQPRLARQAGARLREWHRRIEGVDKHGVRYSAYDPEAYAWVHITAYDAMVRLARLIHGTGLEEAQLEQLYDEWKAVGRLLGIRDDDLPATRDAYWSYFESMIRDRLEYTESVDYWLSGQFVRGLSSPSRLVPGRMWRHLMTPASFVFGLMLRASLPAAFRGKFGIPLERWERRAYLALARVANAVWPLLPTAWQYVPHARQGVKQAKTHPEAFRGARW